MASQLKVDTLTGVTTAGSIDVTGEGNSTTTNLQQGLAKAFGSLDMANSNAVKSSFNIASFTDRATGSLYGNYTNNMGSATDCVCTSGITPAANGSMSTTNGNVYTILSGDTSARYAQNCALVTDNSTRDEEAHQATVFGDLA